MPEIAEVYGTCHTLKKHVLGHTVASVRALDDPIVYGKVGTSADAFEKAMAGKKVVGVGQQGKYFWLEMSSPPHPVMHFGMTGWIEFSFDGKTYYNKKKKKVEAWPPKFWKFILDIEGDGKCEIAFDDARRLGRIRLVHAKAENLRKTTPLKENGPDPMLDADILTVAWLSKKLRSKKVPVKALLLDQANLSGVGNWVADEVLYQAKIHPEQYSNTFSDAQIKRIHDSLMYVCKTSCELIAEDLPLPEHWLMEHRWKKGKGESKLPNGEKIIFLTVGGRTSAVVPSVQKKTGNMSNAAEEAEAEAGIGGGEGEDEKPKSIGKKFFEKFTSKLSQGLAKAPPAKRPREVKEESDDDDEDEDDIEVEEKKPVKKTKRMSKPSAPVKVEDATGDGRRRSTRSSKR